MDFIYLRVPNLVLLKYSWLYYSFELLLDELFMLMPVLEWLWNNKSLPALNLKSYPLEVLFIFFLGLGVSSYWPGWNARCWSQCRWFWWWWRRWFGEWDLYLMNKNNFLCDKGSGVFRSYLRAVLFYLFL